MSVLLKLKSSKINLESSLYNNFVTNMTGRKNSGFFKLLISYGQDQVNDSRVSFLC